MNIDVVQEAFHRSHRGQITFPEQAKMLADAGIEAYHVDLARSEWRYYTPSGESHVEISSEQHAPAADNFCADSVQAALLNIRQGTTDYPKFLEQILAAGCVYYVAYLAGRQVIYFGRKGEFHIEPFPPAH
jgi:uncharacterized protein YbcV (DUF1398 family)